MSADIRFTLSEKQVRTMSRSLRELFSFKSLQQFTVQDIKELGYLEWIGRKVKVSKGGAELLLSPVAHAALTRMVEVLVTAGTQARQWTYGDVSTVTRTVLERCYQESVQPESVNEFLELVASELNSTVCHRTFAAAILGVDLKECDAVKLGELTLVAGVEEVIKSRGLTSDGGFRAGACKEVYRSPCLVGGCSGTYEAAKRWFREQLDLTAGMLAVEAAAGYENGGCVVCIEPVFEGASKSFGGCYLFWNERENHLGHNISFARGQGFPITAARVDELMQPGAFTDAFVILQKQQKSDLEDAITRAVYWFGDANRDSNEVMQFVKYWSCLEALLTTSREDLTEELAVGVVAVLTLGDFKLLERAQSRENKAKVKHLYALRSRAVHSGSYTHVTFRDVALLSRWSAWVIYNAIAFAHRGMKSTRSLRSAVQDAERLLFSKTAADN